MLENVVDIALPDAVKQRQLALGRGFVGQRDFHQRMQEQRLVIAMAVQTAAVFQAQCGDFQGFDGQFAHAVLAERQLQGVLRHAIAQS